MMIETKTKNILQQHGLRLTKSRLAVLQYFLDKKYAIPHSELMNKLTDFDRVTLYRTLTTFETEGIIHKVIDHSNITKYAICSDCEAHHHNDEHVHFNCTNCGLTECLDKVMIPTINLPNGYRTVSTNFLIKGICQKCS